MGKRVYEIAREMGLDNKELVLKIKTMGILVNNHMSVLDSEDVSRIKRQLEREKQTNLEESWIGDGLFVRKAPKKAAAPVVMTAPEPQVNDLRVVPTPRPAPQELRPDPPPPKREEPPPAPKPPEAPLKSKAPPLHQAITLLEPAPRLEAQKSAEPANTAHVEEQAPEAGPVSKPSSQEFKLPSLPEPVPAPARPKKAEAPTPAKSESAEVQPTQAMPAEMPRLGAPVEMPRREPPRPAPVSAAPNSSSSLNVVSLSEPAPAPRPTRVVTPIPAGQQTLVDAGNVRQQRQHERTQDDSANKNNRNKKHGKSGHDRAPSSQDLKALTRPVTPSTPQEAPQQARPQTSNKQNHHRKDQRRPLAPVAPSKPSAPITAPMSQAKKVVRISDTIVVSELAKAMGMKAIDVIKKLISLGMMATLTQSIDYDTASLVASEFGWEVQNVALDVTVMLGEENTHAEDIVTRPPVVTIMGHVDHGKTTLLDSLRKANVAAGEAGGITQHIGAYQVRTDRGIVVFLDTPGHEAFTQMRKRGAGVTDVVVLVVAADDGVKPQTIEAISHAKAAKVPIIVAINKIDKPGADPTRVKTELMSHGIVSEEFGGDSPTVPVSAKLGKGLEDLLETILVQSEVLELKANPKVRAKGVVIEARLDKGRGAVATVIVKEGTLRVGDAIVSGKEYGKVRNLYDDRGKPVNEAGPAIPVEIVGFSGVPNAGDEFKVAENEATARNVANVVEQQMRNTALANEAKRKSQIPIIPVAGEEIAKAYSIVIKADVQGSLEAVKQGLEKLNEETSKVKVNVMLAGVGGITESDVNLASTANPKAVIIGFNVRTAGKSGQLAEQEGIEIRYYNIIYDAIEETRKGMTGVLEPKFIEKSLGRAEVRALFTIPKVGTIAGCMVTDGKISRSNQVRLLRDSVDIYTGRISSLRHFKNDIREIAQGNECGIGIENYNDLKVGDVIEAFEKEQVAATL